MHKILNDLDCLLVEEEAAEFFICDNDNTPSENIMVAQERVDHRLVCFTCFFVDTGVSSSDVLLFLLGILDSIFFLMTFSVDHFDVFKCLKP